MFKQAKKARQDKDRRASLRFHAATGTPCDQDCNSKHQPAPAQTKARPEVEQYRDALFQATQRNDAGAVREKVKELESHGHKLNEPELTDQDNGANLLHYALNGGHTEVIIYCLSTVSVRVTVRVNPDHDSTFNPDHRTADNFFF